MSENMDFNRDMVEAFARFAAAMQEASNALSINFALMRVSMVTGIPAVSLYPAFEWEYKVSGTNKHFAEYIDHAYWHMEATGKLPEEIAQHFRYLTDDGRKYLEEDDEQ